MTDIKNKTAFVTGAASGIGFALAEGLLKRGAKVMMVDIDAEGLAAAQEKLGTENTAIAVCDVADPDAVKSAAAVAIESFGNVHLIFNNAGVSLPGRPGRIALEDWRWITDINILGVVYGCETFIPHIVGHGEGGHIINTASTAGHVTGIGMAPYFATKFAVVGYSEALSQELAEAGIGVSCLCPTWVKSNIHNTPDKAPVAGQYRYKFKSSKAYETIKGYIENGMDADVYAELCLKSVEANRLHVFNDPEARAAVEARAQSLLTDYDANLRDLGH
ncbi:SDR family oxidoreductase [Hellea balneolensis]|uniref:SDR family oxidoreductase n=1 Tax=Hellea balneolensis TaxID=287478 RepID=UPI00041D0F70|nr:SDR family oxidoreductase [Hellea balneolensis]